MSAPMLSELAGELGDYIDGQCDPERYVPQLSDGYLDADKLLLTAMLAQGNSAARLRGLCRGVQNAFERRARADL